MALSEETLVNTTITLGDQTTPVVAGLSDGGWVIAWQASGGDSNSFGINMRRYDANGQTSGDDILVNTHETSHQRAPAIVALDDGGWVVAWESYLQDGSEYGIYQQRYDSAGVAVDDEALVNAQTTGGQHGPTITTGADGGWTVSWKDIGDDLGYFQRYDVDGAKNGEAISIAMDNNASGLEIHGDSDGKFVATWSAFDSEGSYDSFMRIYSADGATLTDPILVNTYTDNDQSVGAAVALDNGNWVIAWSSFEVDVGRNNAYFQLFDSDGNKIGTETQIASDTDEKDFAPRSIVTLADGRFAITWQRLDRDDSNNRDEYFRIFNEDGTTASEITRINTETSGDQQESTIAALEDGGFVITWQSDASGDDDIFMQRYEADGQIYGTNDSPEAESATFKVKEGKSFKFEADDFGFSDIDAHAFSQLVIKKVSGKGTLLLDGVKVQKNDVVSVDDFSTLVWKAPDNAFGKAIGAIEFQVRDDGGTEGAGDNTSPTERITFNVRDVVDSFRGTRKDDTLTGTDGEDILNGKGGNDRLKGKAGEDIFIFKTGYDQDKILDLDAEGRSHDVLDLSALKAVRNFKDLSIHHLEKDGKNLVIDAGDGDSLTLVNVNMKHLDAGDFIF